jgi:hypothetical protein
MIFPYFIKELPNQKEINIKKIILLRIPFTFLIVLILVHTSFIHGVYKSI